MSAATDLRAPVPYFGGKRAAAPLIWRLLGDPGGYVEPFAGSCAVLLARPGWSATGWRRVETVNDADGWLVNTWRSIQLSPDVTAAHTWGPVTEIDYHARLAWLQERRTPDLVAWLEGDPEHHDAKAAGWWLYVVAAGIGDPWGKGPWRVVDGHLRKTGDAGRGVNRGLPHLGDAGRGVNRELPHLGNAGQGVNRGLPHLGDAGQGVNRELRRLAERLARVRITCGDWTRVLTPAVSRSTAGGDGSRAILLDPPYSTSGDVYAHGDDVSEAVREWAVGQRGMRIVLCGYAGDHDLAAHGWTEHVGRASGGGYGAVTVGSRERLWASPECLDPQGRLW